MQIHRRKLIRTAATTGAFILVASLAAFTSGQDAPSGHSMHHGNDQKASDETARSDSMGGGCHEMMDAHKHMMADVDSMNSSLDGLIAEMDAAGGEKKIDAMASVIHELVSQRRRMGGMMTETHPQMMAHMMSHMGDGGDGMMTAMAECPAMKGMMEASEGSKTGGHESHNH